MSDAEYTRGVLYSQKSEKNYTLTRATPSQELSELIETFWRVTWDLRKCTPHVQQNIPDPCINMVFEPHNSRIVGAVTQRYTVELAGKGHIFGIKFNPDGFYALTQSSVSSFTDSTLKISHLFGSDGHDVINNINAANNIETMIELAENFLRPFLPDSIESVIKLGNIMRQINHDSSIMRVSHLADQCGVSERSLQRLFRDQVGVSPKWVIRKCRMQEALSRLEDGNYDWQQLVGQLHYFDQSHFIKDFKSLVGVTPTNYIKALKT